MQAASYTECMSPAPVSPASRGPRLLALDTATERINVAVVDGERQWVADEAGGALASQRVLPLVFELLDRAGLVLRDLDAIAFGRGPGAFTGLRTACSVVQGLAFGAGLPVLSIDSLALVAEDAFEQERIGAVWVAMDARMDEAYAAAYHRDGAQWQVLQAPALWSLAALELAWQEAKQPHQREHVMPFFYDQPERFRILHVNHEIDYGALRWTVDTPEDLELVRQIFARFPDRQDFSWLEVLALFEQEPELAQINAQIHAKDYRLVDTRRGR